MITLYNHFVVILLLYTVYSYGSARCIPKRIVPLIFLSQWIQNSIKKLTLVASAHTFMKFLNPKKLGMKLLQGGGTKIVALAHVQKCDVMNKNVMSYCVCSKHLRKYLNLCVCLK